MEEKIYVISKFPNYGCTKTGKIYSYINHMFLKPQHKGGYLRVMLYKKNTKRKQYLIHRLMAKTFLDNPKNYPIVNHIDTIKHNNCIENLEWCTYQQNVKHAIDVGVNKSKGRQVYRLNKNGDPIEMFESIKNAGEKYGVSGANISKVCRGERNTSASYKWKYVDEKTCVPPKDLETWLPYPGNKAYKISKTGRVYSIKRKIILKTRKNVDGYILVSLVKKIYRCHILVAKTYIPNPNKYPIVNHKDGNKTNNCVENLEWCTHQQNSQHAHNTGLSTSSKSVFQYDKKGVFIKKYKNIKSAAKAVGVSRDAVSNACRKKSQSCAGYFWKFEHDRRPLIIHPPTPTKIKQYTKEGKYIKTFKNINRVLKFLDKPNPSHIYAACNGKRSSAFGYKWKFKQKKECIIIYSDKNKKDVVSVIQYDKEGKYINKYTISNLIEKCDLVENDQDLCDLLEVCNGSKVFFKGFKWIYEGDNPPRIYRRKKCTKIEQYTKEGKYIKTFDSIHDLCEELDIKWKSSIYDCMSGKNKTAHGYIWKKEVK